MTDRKDTNPKDAIATNKLGLHLVPSSLIAAAAVAFTEGALKYGKFNWRVSGVRASVYLDALMRHVFSWANGEECDPITGISHLSSALACIGIIVDAKLCGKLIDDRPPAAPFGDHARETEKHVGKLRELFKSFSPHQHTIMDAIYEEDDRRDRERAIAQSG